MLYDKKKSKGFLYARLRNERIKKKNADKAPVEKDLVRHAAVLSEDQKQHYSTLFKTVVLPKDKDLLLDALIVTVSFREELLKLKEFQEAFPFYFVWPLSVRVRFA